MQPALPQQAQHVDGSVQQPAWSSPDVNDLTLWLEHSTGMPATDAYTCATLLFADGCRSMDDVYMLAEADDLPAEIPKVMRLKIARACAPAFRYGSM